MQRSVVPIVAAPSMSVPDYIGDGTTGALVIVWYACFGDCNRLVCFIFARCSLREPTLVLAPMVDQSEFAFRMFCRSLGCGLAYSPMLYASVIARSASDSSAPSSESSKSSPNAYLTEFFKTCAKDRPLAIQLGGGDPALLAKAAVAVADKCDIVDLNVGCPQAMVRVIALFVFRQHGTSWRCPLHLQAKRRGFGAFLDQDWGKLAAILRCMRQSLSSLPRRPLLGCKIRIQKSVSRSVKYAQMLVDAGCQVLSVHGRTKEQKGRGLADWRHILAICRNTNALVVLNGNILVRTDVVLSCDLACELLL